MTQLIKMTAIAYGFILIAGCSDLSEQPEWIAYEAHQKADPDVVTCRATPKTGTRLGDKVCKTNRDWKLAARDGREALQNIQRTSTQAPTVGGG